MSLAFLDLQLTILPLGELEETISRSYTRSANLRGALCKSQCPQALQHCRAMFEKLVNPQTRNTLITDMLSLSSLDDSDDNEGVTWQESTSRIIPDDLYRALCTNLHSNLPRKAQFLSHLTMHGITYAVASKHAGNSCVLVSMEAGIKPFPARIEYIVQLATPNGVTTHIAIRRHKQADVTSDPFLQFPVIQARMWSRVLEKLEIIPVQRICSHFSCLFMKWEDKEVALVLSLSRVRHPSIRKGLTADLSNRSTKYVA
jgi:hypothetical protein